MVFGTSGYPIVATVGGGEPRPHSGGSATLVYPCGGVASVTVPSGGEFPTVSSWSACSRLHQSVSQQGTSQRFIAFHLRSRIVTGYEFSEDFEIFGTEGKITIQTPGHCPTKVTVNGSTFEYPLEKYSYFGGYPQCNQVQSCTDVLRFMLSTLSICVRCL